MKHRKMQGAMDSLSLACVKEDSAPKSLEEDEVLSCSKMLLCSRPLVEAHYLKEFN